MVGSIALEVAETMRPMLEKILIPGGWVGSDALRGLRQSEEIFSSFITDALKTHPNLVAYVDRIENLPAMKKFLASPERITWPVLGPIALTWGFNKE